MNFFLELLPEMLSLLQNLKKMKIDKHSLFLIFLFMLFLINGFFLSCLMVFIFILILLSYEVGVLGVIVQNKPSHNCQSFSNYHFDDLNIEFEKFIYHEKLSYRDLTSKVILIHLPQNPTLIKMVFSTLPVQLRIDQKLIQSVDLSFIFIMKGIIFSQNISSKHKKFNIQIRLKGICNPIVVFKITKVE